jgi:5-methylcytosine-specific restriction endonuclease McrA
MISREIVTMPLSDLDVLDAILYDAKHNAGMNTMSLSRIMDIIHAKMGTKAVYSDNKTMESFLAKRDFDWSYGLVGGCDSVEDSLILSFLAGLRDDLENLADIIASSGKTCPGLSDLYSYLEGVLSSYREIHCSDDVFSEMELEARHALFLTKVKDYLSSAEEFFKVIDRLKHRGYYHAIILSVKDILSVKLPFDDVGVWLASRIEVPVAEAEVESMIEYVTKRVGCETVYMSYYMEDRRKEYAETHTSAEIPLSSDYNFMAKLEAELEKAKEVEAELTDAEREKERIQNRQRLRRKRFSDMKTIHNIHPASSGYLSSKIAVVTGYSAPFYVVRGQEASGTITYTICHKPSDVHLTGVFIEYAKARPDLRTGKKNEETMARIHFKEWSRSKDRLEFTYLVCSPHTVEDTKVLNLYPNYQSIERVRVNLPKALYTEVYKKNLEFTRDEPSNTVQETKTRRTDVRHLRPLIWSKVYKEAKSGPCLGCNTILHQDDFHMAHIHAHAEGGKECYENLLPLCGGCNRSCSKKHLYQFLLEKNPTVARYHFLADPDFRKYLRYHVNIASALSYLEVMDIAPERLHRWRTELTKSSLDYEHRNSIAVAVIKEYSQSL